MFEKIIHKDRDKVIETGGTLNKIKTLRKIKFIPRYGENITLKEFILLPERDDIHCRPIPNMYEKEITYMVVSKKCKKYYIINVY